VLEAPYNVLDKVIGTQPEPRSRDKSSPRTPIPNAFNHEHDNLPPLKQDRPAPFDPWLKLQDAENWISLPENGHRTWETFALDPASAQQKCTTSHIKSPFVSELSLPHFQRIQERYVDTELECPNGTYL
jgi:hypothetical protein